MAKIAIVDDNKEQRETLRISLRLFLKRRQSSVEVIDIFPFDTFEKYFSWIHEEEICALIFDERLQNDSEGESGPVDYQGNQLVMKIRERYKDIPIFTVTAHVGDDELQARFNEFDYIISRDEFDDKYVDIIIRASQRYLDENQKELSEYDDLTRKVAEGSNNDQNIERLKALQLKLQIPLMHDLKDREDWLEEYEKQITSLEEINEVLKIKLKK